MYCGKPIIGIAGGIGSGKSFVAGLFGELGCAVIDSDAQVKAAYRQEQVKATLVEWWGPQVLKNGEVDRGYIGSKVFSDPRQRQRLEQFLHPLVNSAREREMALVARDSTILAFVWDTPLLFETGLASKCDVIVFVDAPEEVRLRRVREARGWDPNQLRIRENSQWPLDKKRDISDYRISNAADAARVRGQVRELFPEFSHEPHYSHPVLQPLVESAVPPIVYKMLQPGRRRLRRIGGKS